MSKKVFENKFPIHSSVYYMLLCENCDPDWSEYKVRFGTIVAVSQRTNDEGHILLTYDICEYNSDSHSWQISFDTVDEANVFATKEEAFQAAIKALREDAEQVKEAPKEDEIIKNKFYVGATVYYYVDLIADNQIRKGKVFSIKVMQEHSGKYCLVYALDRDENLLIEEYKIFHTKEEAVQVRNKRREEERNA